MAALPTLNRRRIPADEWAKTIVAFESPHQLKQLTSPQGEARQGEEIPLDLRQFKIRLAHSDDRKEASSLLIHKMYSWRGYEGAQLGERENPNRITLLATMLGQVAGTISINLDSDQGLPADEIYRDRLDVLRGEGRRICELTKLAVDDKVKSRRVLAALFHIAFIYGYKIHRGTDFVIEVNPRHVFFYKRMLGLAEFGPERHCTRVNAPAVLLRLELDYADREILRLGGQGADVPAEKSLYPHFFSKDDAAGITVRLLRGDSDTAG